MENGNFSRNDAYKWLSQELNIDAEYTHIGMFSEQTCKRVIELSKAKHNETNALR